MLTELHARNGLNTKQNIFSKNHTLAEHCTDEQKELILKNIIFRKYPKGEIIFHEHQPPFLIFFIYSGVCKLWKEGLHNVEQIIRFAKEGDMIGFWGSFENTNYSLSATAVTDLELCFIQKDVFLPIVETSSVVQIILHDYIKELKKTEDDLRNMAEMNVREKVANSLLVLMDVFKCHMDDDAYRVILSRKEISALSAISEDRVSKQLSDFKREKVIIVNDHKTFIDQKALEDIVRPYMF